MRALFDTIGWRLSKIVTKSYSTSFSLGILLLDRTLHRHIYAIYGFVRFADEIVDTFHDQDKRYLLNDFARQTHDAIDRGISLNPVLNSFQATVNTYKIDSELIDTFLASMEMDIDPTDSYSRHLYEKYILGSAEVVGLMCLKVFCEGDMKMYESLKNEAMKLGSAFQKINFLRDLQSDYYHLGRVYFPNVDMNEFTDDVKADIEEDIENDFKIAYSGILKLPAKARFGVYVAYVYYYALFQKIKTCSAQTIKEQRIRISNPNKYGLLLSSYFRHSFNLL